MTVYQRFESTAAVLMTLLISLVIVVAVVRLASGVINGLVLGALNPLDHKVFQAVFGELITVLIALEFNHSLQYVIMGSKSIVQTKVILLIALLAISRKFIIMDLDQTNAWTMVGLAAIALSLGIVYWLLREHDEHPQIVRAAQRPAAPPADSDV